MANELAPTNVGAEFASHESVKPYGKPVPERSGISGALLAHRLLRSSHAKYIRGLRFLLEVNKK
jgi:hypothetical protein